MEVVISSIHSDLAPRPIGQDIVIRDPPVVTTLRLIQKVISVFGKSYRKALALVYAKMICADSYDKIIGSYLANKKLHHHSKSISICFVCDIVDCINDIDLGGV